MENSLFTRETLELLYFQKRCKVKCECEYLTLEILNEFLKTLKDVSEEDIKNVYRRKYPSYVSREEMIPDAVYFFEGDNQEDYCFLRLLSNGEMEYCNDLKDQMDNEIMNLMFLF